MSLDRELLANALPAYAIGDELGQGGMGVVVSGQHRQLGRRVAIKQLPAAFAGDPSARRRFMAEAQVLASLDHPHVVPVYDFVERDGLCLLVMELLPGGTLRGRVTGAGGITAQYAVAATLACLSGLNAAHRRGVLHRDIKPENMLFAASGVLKVTDFGIAKVSGSPGTVLTRMGEVIGTPAYIAPEQARGLQLSPATDVYGVATMLYELLAGVLPFPGGGDEMSLLFQHAFEKPVPLLEAAPGVPEPVAAVVMHGLATEPADRYATAESFGVALAEGGAHSWGPGWLLAEPVPIMDAGAIISAGGQPAAPAGAAAAPAGAPTAAPAGAPTAAPTAASTAAPTVATPSAGSAGSGAVTVTPGAAATVPETVAAQPPGQPAADRPRAGRRRQVIIAAVVVVVIVAVIVVIVQTHLFTVYKSNGIGPFPAVMYG